MIEMKLPPWKSKQPVNTFICHDKRLHGGKPTVPNAKIIQVDNTTPVGFLVGQIWAAGQACNDLGGELTVKMMCHGLPGFLMCCRGATQPSQHPAGITIADINNGTFSGLKGKVKHIELHACLVARIGSCWETEHVGFLSSSIADGNLFCYRLAQAVGATVKASLHVQYYHYSDPPVVPPLLPPPLGPIDFGKWDGSVMTWGPSGNIIENQQFPKDEEKRNHAVPPEGGSPAAPPGPLAAQRTHVVKTGDYLSKIAVQYYGTAARWRDIYTVNKTVIGSNPDRIFQGQVLIIP